MCWNYLLSWKVFWTVELDLIGVIVASNPSPFRISVPLLESQACGSSSGGGRLETAKSGFAFILFFAPAPFPKFPSYALQESGK